MWYQALIFVPLVAVVLDLLGLLPSLLGRSIIVAVFLLGIVGAAGRSALQLSSRYLRSAVISCAAAVITFLLSTKLELGTVVASGLVGLLGAQVLHGREQLILYLGTFVGMSSTLRFPSLGPLVVAGLVGGILFELSDELWVGVGGRLGTIAAAAVVVVLALMGGF